MDSSIDKFPTLKRRKKLCATQFEQIYMLSKITELCVTRNDFVSFH